jgi:2-keto-4-pentenoate hydratase/2-oxohepta-3-ene-1,7-dioic acid hydratase in catechol pathway
MQFAAGGQFSLGKSYRDYGPIGPWLTTLDDVENPDDLSLRCWVNDELMQDGRTSSMIYGVPHLISAISDICPLLPGDVIFTGTCKGTGVGLDPPRFLKPGDVVRSEIEGLGQIHNAAVAARRS